MDRVLSHTRVSGNHPERWLFLLHGIYGSGRNWGSIGRRLTQERPGWGVILVDLRLHGGSMGFEGPHTLEACARDVALLEESLGIHPNALLGHSFGGKVALLRAGQSSEALEQVWVIDSTLRTGEPSGTAWDVVEIVRSLPDRFSSREEVAEALVEHGYARGVGQWLAMNLERAEGGFRWKLDWAGVEEMLRDYFATDVWGVVENPPGSTRIHLIKAAESNAIDEESARRIQAAGERTGRVDLHTIEGGHWINVDNPEGLLEVLAGEL